MLLKVYPENPAPRHINLIIETLQKGGIIIYPTDTVYAAACDMKNSKAIDQLCQLVGKKSAKKANLSLICSSLANISEYTLPFEKKIYKLMNKSLPGPYTYILRANNQVPKIFNNNRKEIGIRVPDNSIARTLAKELGNPLVTTSLKNDDDVAKYPTNPEDIYQEYKSKVDLVIDGGPGDIEGSTVIDCTNDDPEIIREGKGNVELIY